MNLFGILGILLTSVAQAQPPIPSASLADNYAIYSVMISNYAEAGRESTVALAPSTEPAIGGLLRGGNPCIVPLAQYASRWSEVLADFNARRDKPVALVRELNLSKPYIFVTADERAAFVATRPGPPLRNVTTPPPSVPPRLQGVTHIITLNDVYFSNDRTFALTGISNFCGLLCAKAEWKLYEKREGSWVEVRPASMCMIIA
jgi:hypothetical protein